MPTATLLGASIVTLLLFKSLYGKSSLPLPPGPPGLPIIGNALHLPIERQWVTFAAWAKIYGDVMHVSALGQSIIILSSPQAVTELLERRSAIYSDRPSLIFGGELVGYKDTLPMTCYGERHREHRKLMAEVLGPRAVGQWRAMEERHMHGFLRNILGTPEEFLHHVRRVVASIVLEISHGYKLEEGNDPLMSLAEQAVTDFAEAVVPGRYLCDTIPICKWPVILRYIPAWTGIGFMQDAKRFYKTMVAIRDEPYDMIKRKMAEGTAKPSFTGSLIERDANPSIEQELIYKWTSGGLYTAGADTSVSSISSFFLALSSYTDVQKRAQEELDRIVGRDRLPSLEDRPNLPYLEAIVQELHRWNPVGPLALPHCVQQDDVYRGLQIPGGAIVMANSWAILHDEALYPSPDKFMPERFLGDVKDLNPDPRRFAFGYGRRACPGRDLADDTLFICAAMTLAAFDLQRDDTAVEYTPALICHPVPFRCSITPRSREAQALVTEGK
ncbi:cytochrome P450 [Mycena rosella]|uniref:Cytochrome P450 n=1 Tax=Mycena rosella TaxID=1033263 RepID=A0AAD7DHV0_MYCRO|nr:cytochrome P450 [Mycena rosella]